MNMVTLMAHVTTIASVEVGQGLHLVVSAVGGLQVWVN